MLPDGPFVRAALTASLALLGGAALSWASHLHGSPPPIRAVFGAYVGALAAHFVVDARLWRLRDPGARALVAARLPHLVPALAVSAPGGSAHGIR